MPNEAAPQPSPSTSQSNTGFVAALVVTELALVAWLFWDAMKLATIRTTLRDNLWLTLTGAAILLSMGWGAVQLKLVRSTRARAMLTLFGLIPVLVLIGLLVSTLTFNNYAAAFRASFILFACLFPVALYYLFIVSRKHSLLNEFLTCLSRLGLLQRRLLTPLSANGPTAQEHPADWRRRVITYLQRFEAVYGPIPPDVRAKIGRTTGDVEQLARITAEVDWGRDDGGEGGGVLARETRAPLVHATLLLVLGWLLVLPPWVPQLGIPGSTVEPAKVSAPLPHARSQDRMQSAGPDTQDLAKPRPDGGASDGRR